MLGKAPEFVGREAERARIDAFVAALPVGARALAIQGEPGIGETALWRYALEQSRSSGCRRPGDTARMATEPVGVLTTIRQGSDPADPLAVAKALGPDRCETLDLGPVSIGALRRIVGRAVATISPPALRRMHEVSGGNPLDTLELARGLGRDPEGDRAPAGVSLPDSLQAAIAERLRTVPAELAPLLETASALAPTSAPELRTVLPGHDVARLLVVGDDLRVEFSHPIVASVAYVPRLTSVRINPA